MGDILSDCTFQAALRASLAVLIVIAVILFVIAAWAILQPLLVAVVLATALWPWVSRISSKPLGPRMWRIPRLLATALIYIAAIAVAVSMTWAALAAFVPQLDRVARTYPEQTAFLTSYLEPFRNGDLAQSAAKVAQDVANETARQNGSQPAQQPPTETPPVSLGALAIGLFGGLANLALVLLFTFFLLLEGDRFAQGLFLALPRERRPHIRALGLKMRDQMSRWVLAEALYASISALMIGGVVLVLQLPSPWLYAVLGAFLAVMPGIGPGASLIPAVFVALDESPVKATVVVLIGLLVYALDGTVLVPRLFGGILRIPMLVVLLATLIGALLMGVWGALIGPQIAVAVQMLLRDLMGREPAPSA